MTHHEETIASFTVEQATAVLANGTRAALHQLAGSEPDMRLATLAAFLWHLCQVDPARREKMAGVLNAVRDTVAAAEA